MAITSRAFVRNALRKAYQHMAVDMSLFHVCNNTPNHNPKQTVDSHQKHEIYNLRHRSQFFRDTVNAIANSKDCKGFLTAIIDLDQRRPIVIRRVYDANVLREDYLTMDKKKRFSLSLQQHAITSSSRPTVDAAGNANLPSTSTFP